MDYTVDECLNYLYEKYEAPEDYNTAQKRMYVYYDLTLSDKSLMCLTLAQKLTEIGETIIDSIPLDTEYPFIPSSSAAANQRRKLEAFLPHGRRTAFL